MDWSKTGNLIAQQFTDPLQRVQQLWTLKPDGSSPINLSGLPRPAGSPLAWRDKNGARWREPAEDWLIVAGEMAAHFGGITGFSITPRNEFFGILNGLFCDIYAVKPDNTIWYKLTNYLPGIVNGALNPTLSADGNTLYWAEYVKGPSAAYPFGQFSFATATFTVTAGVPSIGAISYLALPPNWQLLYPCAASPDGTKLLLVVYDIAGAGLAILQYTIIGGTVADLTQLPSAWHEHPIYNPAGTKIAWMTSRSFPALNFQILGKNVMSFFLQTEIWTMNADGTGAVQLTHFNIAANPETMPYPFAAGECAYNGDGTRLAISGEFTQTRYFQFRFGIYNTVGPTWTLLADPAEQHRSVATHRLPATHRVLASHRLVSVARNYPLI